MTVFSFLNKELRWKLGAPLCRGSFSERSAYGTLTNGDTARHQLAKGAGHRVLQVIAHGQRHNVMRLHLPVKPLVVLEL